MSVNENQKRFETTLAVRDNRVTFGALNNRFNKETTYQPNVDSDLRLINSFFTFLLSLDKPDFINTIALKKFLEQIVKEAEEANTIPDGINIEELKQIDTMAVVSIATIIKRNLEGGNQFKVSASVQPHYDEFIKAIKVLALKKA